MIPTCDHSNNHMTVLWEGGWFNTCKRGGVLQNSDALIQWFLTTGGFRMPDVDDFQKKQFQQNPPEKGPIWSMCTPNIFAGWKKSN